MEDKVEGRSIEEIKGVTLLGNQGVKYEQDYAPGILETFVNIGQFDKKPSGTDCILDD